MIVTHVEYYTFPNTPEGRSKAENWESILHRIGCKAVIKTTTTSITVGYEETIAIRPPELDLMKEESEVTNDA